MSTDSTAPDDRARDEQPAGGDARCDECGHPRYEHDGRGGRCSDGRQKDTAAWRCDCMAFVAQPAPR